MHGKLKSSEDDHEPLLGDLVDDKDVRLICDFCGVYHPVWDFPCRTFEFHDAHGKFNVAGDGVNPTDMGFDSGGDWTACDDCAQLIIQDNYDALAYRALRQHVKPGTEAARPEYRAELLRRMRALHQAFRINRLGPPSPIEQGHWIAAQLSTIFQLGE